MVQCIAAGCTLKIYVFLFETVSLANYTEKFVTGFKYMITPKSYDTLYFICFLLSTEDVNERVG